jgi:hypothetical protein
MSEDQQINEASDDRREETAVTQQPDTAAAEQFARYVAAEKRLHLVLVTRIIWVILGLLEILWVISYRPRETQTVTDLAYKRS